MVGVLLLGIAVSVFNPGSLLYLAMTFGASAGIAYAASKNQVAHTPLPAWAITSIGVTSAVIYGVAGMPGLMLTAGLSGGWYLNSYFGHRFQQWKTNFQDFLTKFKNNPIRQSVNLTFNALQFLADILTPVENIPPAPVPNRPVQEDTPITISPHITPEGVAVIPATPNSTLITVATPKPEAAVIRFLGHPLLTTPRKEIKIDFAKGYGLPGLLKAFWYSLNPMNDIVDINKDEDKNKNIEMQPKPILGLTNNTRLEMPQSAPVVFRREPSLHKVQSEAIIPPTAAIVAENNQTAQGAPIILTETVLSSTPPLQSSIAMSELTIKPVAEPKVATAGRFSGFFSWVGYDQKKNASSSMPKPPVFHMGYNKAIICEQLPSDLYYHNKTCLYLVPTKDDITAHYHTGTRWVESNKTKKEFQKALPALEISNQSITELTKLKDIITLYACPARREKIVFTIM
jgi:hypothetical protein